MEKILTERAGRISLAVLCYALACAIFLRPIDILKRFSELPVSPELAVYSLYGFGAGMIALGISLTFTDRRSFIGWALFLAASVAVLSFQTWHMSDWLIDDAGITFAYSRSMAEGIGLTFQPGSVPEEGYSSTLWMLILAFSGRLGFDILATSKVLGVLFGGAALSLAILMTRYMTGRFLPATVTLFVTTTAPFAIWSASGQEHAIQALLLTLVAVSLGARSSYFLGTIWLTILVFTRPEAPIIVATCFFTAAVLSVKKGQRVDLRRTLPIALFPFIAFVLLTVFRVWYFGDPFPNPYYAKTSENSILTIANPFGGGWNYLLAFLISSGVAIILPFLILTNEESHQRCLAFLWSVLLGHLIFVIWARGDWMGQFRFVMPVLPILGILAASGFSRFIDKDRRWIAAPLVAAVLATNSVYELNSFKAKPTTPFSVVSKIGREFEELALKLGIPRPLLAHHDAGAITYERSVGLLDLGGLVNRDIAKNLEDAIFLERYVLLERKPDFIFGAHNFAARSGFLQSDRFEIDYLPLEFPGKPFMESEYSHIRRDRIDEVVGVELRRGHGGEILKVIVRP